MPTMETSQFRICRADIQAHIKWVEALAAGGNFREGNPLLAKGTTLKKGTPWKTYQRSLDYTKNETDLNFINRKIKIIMSNYQY